MRLLASVRSADEVEAAVSGGADIIDAKEPGRGSLGAVSPEVFAQIQARVPLDLELSAALGDVANQLEVRTSIAALKVISRPAPVYLKLGFSGVSQLEAAESPPRGRLRRGTGGRVWCSAHHRRGVRRQ